MIIALLIAAVAGVLAFFVLPATIAWIGWVVFAVAVVGMLIYGAVTKKDTNA